MHRVGFSATVTQQRELTALGAKWRNVGPMPGGHDPFISFDVAEDHPNWPRLRDLLRQWRVSDFLRTEFSKREIDDASWLDIGAWHHGYPQPDEDVFGYRQVTYDLSNWCEKCGMGKTQKAPFQMKGEPKWGRKAILQLIWVYDELFVTPELWASVFKPVGIGRRAVTDRRGRELATAVQLVIDEEVHIVTDGLPSERCGACNRVKYLPVARGSFPMLTDEPTQPMARTWEYFGSGGQANNGLLISQGLVRSLAAEKVRGVYFRPVAGT